MFSVVIFECVFCRHDSQTIHEFRSIFSPENNPIGQRLKPKRWKRFSSGFPFSYEHSQNSEWISGLKLAYFKPDQNTITVIRLNGRGGEPTDTLMRLVDEIWASKVSCIITQDDRGEQTENHQGQKIMIFSRKHGAKKETFPWPFSLKVFREKVQ